MTIHLQSFSLISSKVYPKIQKLDNSSTQDKGQQIKTAT